MGEVAVDDDLVGGGLAGGAEREEDVVGISTDGDVDETLGDVALDFVAEELVTVVLDDDVLALALAVNEVEMEQETVLLEDEEAATDDDNNEGTAGVTVDRACNGDENTTLPLGEDKAETAMLEELIPSALRAHDGKLTEEVEDETLLDGKTVAGVVVEPGEREEAARTEGELLPN